MVLALVRERARQAGCFNVRVCHKMVVYAERNDAEVSRLCNACADLSDH